MSTPLTPEAAAQDQRVVDQVRVVVHTLGPAGPTISDNHWSIYLLLAGGQGSVRMNMRADPEYVNGTLNWTKQAYLLTQSAVRHRDFAVVQGVQVCHIAGLVHQLGRQRYDMSGGGSGCRYWIYTILYDLAHKKWVPESAATGIWPDLLFRYHTTDERKRLHMVQGTFY